MEGMGIYILLLMYLCVIVPLSLIIGAALSFGGIPLIYKLKGIPKEKRRIRLMSKITFGFFLSLLFGLTITIGLGVYTISGRTWFSSQKSIFHNATDLEVPAGVDIIDSKNSFGFAIKYWLHFTASPLNINDILSSDNFVEQINFSFDFSSLKPPAWWRPKNMGTGIRYYECEGCIQEEHIWGKCMFVNANTDEVYYLRLWY
jgi:hypothetical protein